MGLIRRHIRLWTIVWALGQLAMVTGLLPQDCCAAHGSDHVAAGHCGTAARGDQCPMRAADGTPCPMHRENRARDCSIRGTCAAPAAALLVVLSQHAVLPAFVTLPADAGIAAEPMPPQSSVGLGGTRPDVPPPRA